MDSQDQLPTVVTQEENLTALQEEHQHEVYSCPAEQRRDHPEWISISSMHHNHPCTSSVSASAAEWEYSCTRKGDTSPRGNQYPIVDVLPSTHDFNKHPLHNNNGGGSRSTGGGSNSATVPPANSSSSIPSGLQSIYALAAAAGHETNPVVSPEVTNFALPAASSLPNQGAMTLPNYLHLEHHQQFNNGWGSSVSTSDDNDRQLLMEYLEKSRDYDEFDI